MKESQHQDSSSAAGYGTLTLLSSLLLPSLSSLPSYLGRDWCFFPVRAGAPRHALAGRSPGMLRLAGCVSSLWNCTFLLALVLAFLSMPKLCTFVSHGRNYFEFELFNISKNKPVTKFTF